MGILASSALTAKARAVWRLTRLSWHVRELHAQERQPLYLSRVIPFQQLKDPH